MLQLADDITSGPLAKLTSSPLFTSLLESLRYCGEGVKRERGGRGRGWSMWDLQCSCVICPPIPSIPSCPPYPLYMSPTSFPSLSLQPFCHSPLTHLLLTHHLLTHHLSSPTSSSPTSSPHSHTSPTHTPLLPTSTHTSPHTPTLTPPPLLTSRPPPLTHLHAHTSTHIPPRTHLHIYWSLQVLLGTGQCLPLGKEGPTLPPKPHPPSSCSKCGHLWAAMCRAL